jgi:antitoxin component of MazEF toxin-antitoxin module
MASVREKGLRIPESITKKAGIKPGDLVEFTVQRGKITIHAAVPREDNYPIYTPTKAEAAAIRKGRAAYKRGHYVTLDKLRDELDVRTSTTY